MAYNSSLQGVNLWSLSSAILTDTSSCCSCFWPSFHRRMFSCLDERQGSVGEFHKYYSVSIPPQEYLHSHSDACLRIQHKALFWSEISCTVSNRAWISALDSEKCYKCSKRPCKKVLRNYFWSVDVMDSLKSFGNIAVLQIFSEHVTLDFTTHRVKRNVIPEMGVLYTSLDSFVLTFHTI